MKQTKKKSDKPLIFTNDQRGITIKEYKKKLKQLISDNEDYIIQIRLVKESLINYKKYLSEIGLANKSNQINTGRNFNEKIGKLIKNETKNIANLLMYIEQNIKSLEKQQEEFMVKIEERQLDSHENNVKEDMVFTLKNLYVSKEHQIMYLQAVINAYVDNKVTHTFAEYYDLEDEIVHNIMDSGLTGIRNNMAKYTRILNLEDKKNKENKIKIQDMTKEINELKNPSPNTNQNSSFNNTQTLNTNSQNTRTSITNHSTPNHYNTIQVNEDEVKIKLKKNNKREEKYQIVRKLEDKLKQNYKLYDEYNSAIKELNEENEFLQNEIYELNDQLSGKFTDIYSLEMKIENMKLQLSRKAVKN